MGERSTVPLRVEGSFQSTGTAYRRGETAEAAVVRVESELSPVVGRDQYGTALPDWPEAQQNVDMEAWSLVAGRWSGTMQLEMI